MKRLDDKYEMLLVQYKKKGGITEELKELDQVRWMKEMNSIDKCIEEIIRNTVIY